MRNKLQMIFLCFPLLSATTYSQENKMDHNNAVVVYDSTYQTTLDKHIQSLNVHFRICQTPAKEDLSHTPICVSTYYEITIGHNEQPFIQQTIIDTGKSITSFAEGTFFDGDVALDGDGFEPASLINETGNEFIQMVDINFDGYKDIRILVGGTTNEMVYHCWLFDPVANLFRLNEDYSMLHSNVSINTSKKLIWIYKATPQKTTTLNYSIKNGHPVLVEYDELEPTKKGNRNVNKVTHYKMVGNKFKIISTKYID
jgi:hypothetical protein